MPFSTFFLFAGCGNPDPISIFKLCCRYGLSQGFCVPAILYPSDRTRGKIAYMVQKGFQVAAAHFFGSFIRSDPAAALRGLASGGIFCSAS